MKRTGITILFGFIFLINQGLAEGKKDSLKVYYLDEIVVTAKRTEAKLKDCSATVSLITKEDIEASNANSCTDILGYLPGVFIQKTGNFGRADLNIRGIGSRGRRILVLIDGKPEKMGLFGCTITHSLPLDNVEKIEVVRGPNSVLYGSDALGGVVNILTKKPEETEVDYTFSYGSFNTYQNRIRSGAKLKRFDFYATADKRKSKGHLPNSTYNGEEYSARVGYQLTQKIQGTLQGRYFKGYKEEPSPAEPETWNDYERTAIDFSLDSKLSNWNGNLKLYHNWGEHIFSDGWHSEDFTYGMSFQLSPPQWRANRLILGSEFRKRGGKRLNGKIKSWDKDEFSIYFKDEQLLLKRLILSFGARYNHDQFSGSDFSSHLGAVFNLTDGTILRSVINRGFRAPQINELLMFPSSNQDLKPERVLNYEIGLNQRIIGGVNIDVVGYSMKGDNLIQLEKNLTPPPMFIFQNTGEFDFKGMELGTHVKRGETLSAQIYYSYLNPGEKTQGRPQSKFSFQTRYQPEKFIISISGQYIWNYYAEDNHKSPIDDFLILNSKFSYEITSGIKAFLGCDNLLNESHTIYVNLPSGSGLYSMPSRGFTIGLTLFR